MGKSIQDDIDWNRRSEKEVRDLIFELYWKIVGRIIQKRRQSIPTYIDQSIIESAAHLGFVSAIDSFDPTVAKFTTYMPIRVKFAITDAMREEDPNSRTRRIKSNKREKAEQALTQELGRKPTDDEVQTHLGLTSEQYADSICHGVFTQNTNCRNDKKGKMNERDLAGDNDIEPQKNINRWVDVRMPFSIAESFREATKGLDFDQQTILYLYYFRDAKMHVIGEAMGLSESRVSQLHSQALKAMRLSGRDKIIEAIKP